MQKSEKDENKNCAKNNQKGSIGLRLNSCTYCCCISREHVELVDLEDLFMMAGLRDWWNTWSNWKICKFIWKYLTNCKNIQKKIELIEYDKYSEKQKTRLAFKSRKIWWHFLRILNLGKGLLYSGISAAAAPIMCFTTNKKNEHILMVLYNIW